MRIPREDTASAVRLPSSARLSSPVEPEYRLLIPAAMARIWNPLETVQRQAKTLTGAQTDFDPLLDAIGDAQYVLLGEASHGSHEFYVERARITRRLIEEHGFAAVAVEADWPDAWRANCYVRGAGRDAHADDALSGFERFPTWMWRNTVVLEFIEWLRDHNSSRSPERRAGFYGLDLYSLHASIAAVLDYLERVDPPAADRARRRYACFDHFGEDVQAYGYAANAGLAEPCQDEVLAQLVELRRRAGDYLREDGESAHDALFYAEQNARLVRNAEEYYRTMFRGRTSSWNLRDRHMAETLEALVRHLARGRSRPRVVVWAHNSHLGDARATRMGERGELNLGQLVRERHGSAARLIGFTTFAGWVTAATDWDEPPQRMRVRDALEDSYERLLHDALPSENFLLSLRANGVSAALYEPMLERAIGVIYRPQTERLSHYFEARLPAQFDAVIHLDTTSAVQPIEAARVPSAAEPPETYPTGM
jgi:erythromycin esterase-like protein